MAFQISPAVLQSMVNPNVQGAFAPALKQLAGMSQQAQTNRRQDVLIAGLREREDEQLA